MKKSEIPTIKRRRGRPVMDRERKSFQGVFIPVPTEWHKEYYSEFRKIIDSDVIELARNKKTHESSISHWFQRTVELFLKARTQGRERKLKEQVKESPPASSSEDQLDAEVEEKMQEIDKEVQEMQEASETKIP